MSTVQMFWGSSDIPSGIPANLSANYTSNARGLIISGMASGPGCGRSSCGERTHYLTFLGRFYVSKQRMPYQGTEFTSRPNIHFDGQLHGSTGGGAWFDDPSAVCGIRIRQIIYSGSNYVGSTELRMPKLVEIVDRSRDSEWEPVFGNRRVPSLTWTLDRDRNLEIDIEVRFTMKLEGTGAITYYNGNLEPGFTFNIPQWFIDSNRITVTISPQRAFLFPRKTQQFRAVVTGTTNKDVTWTASSGTISSTGLYRAPSSGRTAIVTARSRIDPSVESRAKVYIENPNL